MAKNIMAKFIDFNPQQVPYLFLVFIVFGVLYSAYNVGLNTERYFSYPSQTKPAVESEGVVRFPKVTACLNVSVS